MEPATSFGWKKYPFLVLGVILVIVFWEWIDNPMTATVSGNGQVSVPAANAVVSFTITTNDPSAQGAISAVNTKAQSIKQLIVNSGVPETDIIQSQVTAVPSGLVTAGTTGFQATISMSFKTVHVSTISDLVSSLYSNGVYVVSQPVLSVDNQDILEQKALEDAMKDADKKAGKLGLSKWKFIRKVTSVSQVTSPTTSTSTTTADTLTQSNNQTAAQNGVFLIVKAVSVTYKLW